MVGIKGSPIIFIGEIMQEDNEKEDQLRELILNLGIFILKILIWVVAFLWLADLVQK